MLKTFDLYKTVYFWGVKSVRVSCESLQDVHGESPLTMSAQGVGLTAEQADPRTSKRPRRRTSEARRRGSAWSGCRLPVACRNTPCAEARCQGATVNGL